MEAIPISLAALRASSMLAERPLVLNAISTSPRRPNARTCREKISSNL